MARDLDELKERLINYSSGLISSPILKVVGIETAILTQTAKEIESAVFLVFILTLTDLITALIASIRLNKLSSWGLRQTVLKLSIYLLLIFLGGMTNVVTHTEWINSAFMGLIVTTEMLSVLENIELIKPGLLPRNLLNRFGITLKKRKKGH